MDLALWRYGIISPLLHRQANETQVGELLDHLAGQNYVRPDGAIVTLSAETIRKWLYRYNRGGLPALGNKQRSDKGRYDVPAVLSEAIHRLRQEHPGWTLALILKELMDSGLWNGLSPSRSTMYRFASARNLRRDPDVERSQACRSFSFTKFGQLWTADFLHGPRLKLGKQKKKTYLHAIMDDASRYVVGAGFYHNENLESLIGELMKACRTFGLPQRLYTDNVNLYIIRIKFSRQPTGQKGCLQGIEKRGYSFVQVKGGKEHQPGMIVNESQEIGFSFFVPIFDHRAVHAVALPQVVRPLGLEFTPVLGRPGGLFHQAF